MSVTAVQQPMPPKRCQNSKNSMEKEGRVLLATSALNYSKIPSVQQQATRSFNVLTKTESEQWPDHYADLYSNRQLGIWILVRLIDRLTLGICIAGVGPTMLMRFMRYGYEDGDLLHECMSHTIIVLYVTGWKPLILIRLSRVIVASTFVYANTLNAATLRGSSRDSVSCQDRHTTNQIASSSFQST